jgi:hypothetical protein
VLGSGPAAHQEPIDHTFNAGHLANNLADVGSVVVDIEHSFKAHGVIEAANHQ